MLFINPKLNGLKFNHEGKTFVVLGYGQHPTNGTDYVLGLTWTPKGGFVRSVKMTDVTFLPESPKTTEQS